jgi:outer membrane protein TolC
VHLTPNRGSDRENYEEKGNHPADNNSGCAMLNTARRSDDGSIDIYKAVELTLQNNSALRSLRQETIKAYAFKIQADGTLLPSITADAGLDKQKESTTNDGARNDNKTTAVTLEQIIYSGGKNSALRDQSKQVKSMAEMIIADGENNAVGELYARFYNVLLQKERIKAEESAVRTSEQHLKEVQRMRELGLANSLEVIRADSSLPRIWPT